VSEKPAYRLEIGADRCPNTDQQATQSPHTPRPDSPAGLLRMRQVLCLENPGLLIQDDDGTP
ncbi:MAG: hypothetical protein KDA89_16080, partial [Planctomycetaceae bacterium]|nr:hypothetical protein [Planctomycetaceae bacterium]